MNAPMVSSQTVRPEDAGRRILFDQPYLLATLTMLFWASNTLIGRAVVDHVPPVALAQMRWTLAFLVLLPFAAGTVRRDIALVRAHIVRLSVLGLLGITIYNTFLYIGVQTTTAVNAAMLSSLFPMTVAALGFLIYRDRLTLLQGFGIALSCVGAAVILSHGSLVFVREFRFVLGDLWVLASMVVYALYTVLLKGRPPVHPLTLVTVTIFLGQLFLWPFTVAEGLAGARVHLDLVTVASVLYVVIFPAILAYIFFNRAVELIGSNRIAPFFHLLPVFASLGAVALIGERLQPYHFGGWGLIFTGIVATQMFRPRPRPPGPPSG